MYAVIETGGKQYRVSPGDIMDVELLPDAEQVVFKNVLLFVADGGNIAIGAPTLPNVSVTAKVLEKVKDDKVTTFKYKHKINYHRTIGHRQNYTRIKIENISA